MFEYNSPCEMLFEYSQTVMDDGWCEDEGHDFLLRQPVASGLSRTSSYTHLLTYITYGQVPENEQDRLHDAIYNKEWGLKSVAPATDRAKRRFEGYVRQLHKAGAEAVILGCTGTRLIQLVVVPCWKYAANVAFNVKVFK